MHRLNIILFISFLVFSSCEDEIAFKGSDTARKLVVNCLIAGDSTIVAYVKHSNFIQNPGNGDNVVPNAKVRLYENSQFMGLLTLNTERIESNNFYESSEVFTLKDFKPTTGNSYKLEVEAPNYESVTTQVTIPNPVPIMSIDTSFISVKESWGSDSKAINFAITINDPLSEKNYYRIVIKEKVGRTKVWGENPTFYNVFIRQSISFLQSNDLSLNPTGNSNDDMLTSGAPNKFLVFNDDLFDGKEHMITVFDGYYERPRYEIKEFNEYTIELHSISKEYYLYVKSLSLFSSKDGDPFAEPVQVFSNVENGYGIFGAYSVSKKIVLDGVYPDELVEYFYE